MTNGLGSLPPFGFMPSWPKSESCCWHGASGMPYFHSIHPFVRTTSLRDVNYLFVRREWNGFRTALYIGETENLSERLPDHHKFDAALRLGANELHVHHLAWSRAERLRIETDLRNALLTPLNEQPSGGLLGLGAAAINPFGLYDPFK